MAAGYDPNVERQQIEEARRKINQLAEEIAQLSEMELAPPEYYGEFLQRLLTAIAAPGGAVWIRTPQGNLQLQYQINMHQVGLDRAENSRQMHDELLRQAAMKGQPGLFLPRSGIGAPEGGGVAAGNPTDYVVLLAPILYDKQVAGLVEVWQDPNRGQDAQRGFLHFMAKMAGLAAGYTRNHQLRQMVGQQQVWTQLEAFARQIHGSLNPTEVGFLVANEGRRLAECDRISVAMNQGGRPAVQAISGADVVEKRSNLVQLMRSLFEEVMKWGEKLVYCGSKDDTLPPGVNKALDAYLAESNSKLLVVMPLRDDRETNKKKPPRSGLMMECFEPAAAPEQLVARLEVIGRHATAALYNAVEYRRIPMRFLWAPLAKVQDGLGGKAKAIWTLVLVGLVVLITAMVVVPYPLKMDSRGQVLTMKRNWVFSPIPGQVFEIPKSLKTGTRVTQGQEIIKLYDQDLADKINERLLAINKANMTIAEFRSKARDNDKANVSLDIRLQEIERDGRENELQELLKRYNASRSKPGVFSIRAPITGIILTGDFRDTLLNRAVKPNEPLLRIGFFDQNNPNIADWEVELKIPQKHVGQVLAGFDYLKTEELDVDFLLASMPTRTFKGKLARKKVAFEANPNRDDNNEAEPVVLAWVRLHGDDIPEGTQLTPELLRSGIEVHTRIRCGNHAMGYSLFYGVWEFIYEKFVFFF